ncbi:MAG: FliM/FliN family flagellar motor switch protein [Pseudomonadota bacterium]
MAPPDKSFLDSEEYAAIRDALSGGGRGGGGSGSGRGHVEIPAVPVALISEDRATERAIPDGQKLVDRWIPEVRHVLGRLFGKEVEVSAGQAEIVDDNGVKRALEKCWMARIEVPGRRGVCLLVASGPILEIHAVHRFHGEAFAGAGRSASPTIVSLFGPLGHALARGLAEAFKEVQGAIVEISADDNSLEQARRSLERAKTSVVLEIQIKGNVEGTVRLVTSPEVLAAPPRQLEAVPAEPGALKRALGSVPSLLHVEMGRTSMPLRSLGELQPGTILTLDRFVGDLLPVRCQGVLVAKGRAVISRGALAVEIAQPDPTS